MTFPIKLEELSGLQIHSVHYLVRTSNHQLIWHDSALLKHEWIVSGSTIMAPLLVFADQTQMLNLLEARELLIEEDFGLLWVIGSVCINVIGLHHYILYHICIYQ